MIEIGALSAIVLGLSAVAGFLFHSLYALHREVRKYQEFMDRYIEIRCKELGLK
jgi:hypothetical protein